MTTHYEIQIQELLKYLHRSNPQPKPLQIPMRWKMKKCLPILTYLKQELCPVSNIPWNRDLVEMLLDLRDLSDLKNSHSREFAIQKHLQAVIRLYLLEINRGVKIQVTDRAKFQSSLHQIGLYVFDQEPDPPSLNCLSLLFQRSSNPL